MIKITSDIDQDTNLVILPGLQDLNCDSDIGIGATEYKLELFPSARIVAFVLAKAVLELDNRWMILPGGHVVIGPFKVNGYGKSSTLEWKLPNPPKEFFELEKYFNHFINMTAFM